MPEQPQIVDWPALILKADESSDPERALATLANMATRRDPAPGIPVWSEEIARLRKALAYSAKPRTYGSGEHAIFIDDCGVAKAALGRP